MIEPETLREIEELGSTGEMMLAKECLRLHREIEKLSEPHEGFKIKLEEIFREGHRPNISHEEADNLLVEVLESLGYDLSVYKSAEKWYD